MRGQLRPHHADVRLSHDEASVIQTWWHEPRMATAFQTVWRNLLKTGGAAGYVIRLVIPPAATGRPAPVL